MNMFLFLIHIWFLLLNFFKNSLGLYNLKIYVVGAVPEVFVEHEFIQSNIV